MVVLMVMIMIIVLPYPWLCNINVDIITFYSGWNLAATCLVGQWLAGRAQTDVNTGLGWPLTTSARESPCLSLALGYWQALNFKQPGCLWQLQLLICNLVFSDSCNNYCAIVPLGKTRSWNSILFRRSHWEKWHKLPAFVFCSSDTFIAKENNLFICVLCS